LAAKIDGSQATWQYDSAWWTNPGTFNADVTQLASNAEAKLQPFVDVAGTQVRLVMSYQGTSGSPATLPTGAFSSLMSLISGGTLFVSPVGSNWENLVPGGTSYEDRDCATGINVNCGWRDGLPCN